MMLYPGIKDLKEESQKDGRRARIRHLGTRGRLAVYS
jgi:hypothetical protein